MWFKKYIFQFSQCKFSHIVNKSQYQSIIQYFIPKQRNFSSAAVQNSFNMPGVDKLCPCIRYVIKIINFTNCHTCSFSYKYLTTICTSGFKNKECMFSTSCFIFWSLFLKSYCSFLKQSTMEWFSNLILLSIANDQCWKHSQWKHWELTPWWGM